LVKWKKGATISTTLHTAEPIRLFGYGPTSFQSPELSGIGSIMPGSSSSLSAWFLTWIPPTRRSLRHCRLYNQPFCLRIIRPSGKISKELDVSKAGAKQAIPELLTRVNRMFETKTSRLTFFDQDPFVRNTSPAIANLTAFD